MKRTTMLVAVLFLCQLTAPLRVTAQNGTITTNPGGGQRIVEGGHIHDCDAPWIGGGIHEGHGTNHCGNLFSGNAEAENCVDEVVFNSQLIKGEYLSCGLNSGPLGVPGCSYDIILRCQGTMRTHNFNLPENPNGSLPLCGFNSFSNYYYCGLQQCQCSGTSLICN